MTKAKKRVILIIIGVIVALVGYCIIIYFNTPLKWEGEYYADKLHQQINGEKFVKYASAKYPDHQFTLDEYFDIMQNVERKDTHWSTILDESNNEFMVIEDPDTKEMFDNYDYVILGDKLAQQLTKHYNNQYIFKVNIPYQWLSVNERCNDLNTYYSSQIPGEVKIEMFTSISYTDDDIASMIPIIINVVKPNEKFILNVSQLDNTTLENAKNKNFSITNFNDWERQIKSNHYVIMNGQIIDNYKMGM